jgi:hypothetical protein
VTDQLHAVLLVGGSSRMPIVSQLVSSELGYPVAVDAHPKHAVALGAAWVASGVSAEPPPPDKVEGRVAQAAPRTAVVTPPSTPAVTPVRPAAASPVVPAAAAPVVPVLPMPPSVPLVPSASPEAPTLLPAAGSSFAPGKATVPSRASSSGAGAAGAATVVGGGAGVARVSPAPAWSQPARYEPPSNGRPGRWRTVILFAAAAALVAGLAAGSFALYSGMNRGNPLSGQQNTAPPVSTGPGQPTVDPTTPAATSQAPPPVTYPQTASAYALAATQAWRQGRNNRIDQLVDPGTGIFDTLNGGDYNKEFSVYKCTSSGGYSQCAMYNKPGDILELKIRDDRLGEAHAITDGVFTQITFPDDLRAYGQLTIDNWLRENKGAVALLTTKPGSSAFDPVPEEKRTSGMWTYDRSDGAAGRIYHIWRGDAGDEIALAFNNPDLVAPPSNRHHLVIDVLFTAAP